MEVFDEQVLLRIRDVLRLKAKAEELEVEGMSPGWLNATLAANAVEGHVRNLIDDFNGSRGFMIALANFLVEKELIPPLPSDSVRQQPDFIDMMQDRVV